MLCQKCGKEIPSDSKFCNYCSHKVDDHFNMQQEEKTHRCVLCGERYAGLDDICGNCARKVQAIEEYNVTSESAKTCVRCGKTHFRDGSLCEECSSNRRVIPDKKNQVAAAIGIAVIVIFVMVIGVNLVNVLLAINEDIPAPVSVSASSSGIISESPAEARSRLLKEASIAMAKNAELHIKDHLKYPETAQISYSSASLTYDAAYALSEGVISYTNAQGDDVEKTYEVGMYTDDIYNLAVYIKLGDKVLTDDRSSFDRNGRALKTITLNNKKIIKGDLVFSDIVIWNTYFDKEINSQQPDTSSSSVNDGVMTLAKFNKIETGMSYEDVCDIVGSNGTLLSETEMAGYHTFVVMWYGKGMTGANANVTIQNNKVITKAQFGLG